MTPSSPLGAGRIQAVEAPFEAAVAERLAAMMPAGQAPIGLFRTFVKNLPMAEAMSGWGGYELSRRMSLSLREREIAIVRTCARCGCEYEWGVHVNFFAVKAGLGRAEIASLTHGSPADPCWTADRERVVIRVADALHDSNDITDELWHDARATPDSGSRVGSGSGSGFSDAELLDLFLLCGWYHAISFAARAARVPLEPGTPRFADMITG